MANVRINHIDSDFLSLRADVFVGNPALAILARETFMNTKGFTSFEVSTQSGDVFIGFHRKRLAHEGARAQAETLLQLYFPGPVAALVMAKLPPMKSTDGSNPPSHTRTAPASAPGPADTAI